LILPVYKQINNIKGGGGKVFPIMRKRVGEMNDHNEDGWDRAMSRVLFDDIKE
jgi:hypothetical protein